MIWVGSATSQLVGGVGVGVIVAVGRGVAVCCPATTPPLPVLPLVRSACTLPASRAASRITATIAVASPTIAAIATCLFGPRCGAGHSGAPGVYPPPAPPGG